MVVKLQLQEISLLDKEVQNTTQVKMFTWEKIILYMLKLMEL